MSIITVTIKDQFTDEVKKVENFYVSRKDGDVVCILDENNNEVKKPHYIFGIVEFMKGQN